MERIKPKFIFGDNVKFYLQAFPREGVVTYCFLNGNFDVCYHVRDSEGNYWHRIESELEIN